MKNGKKNLWKAVKKAAELEADMKNTGWQMVELLSLECISRRDRRK